jgi:hypothetical protein
MERHFWKLVILIFFLGWCNTVVYAADEESLAQQAEQVGKLREALTHYVVALQSVPEGSTKDQQLREKIIKLVQKLTPPPIIPDEARRFAVRGATAIKEAKNSSDYLEAAKEFDRALRLAPWWAESYFNQAVALEKAEKFDSAIRSLKFYLLAAPNVPDAEKVKDQIYTLEYKQEKAQKETSTKRQAMEQEQQRAKEAANPQQLAGTWIWEKGLINNPVQITVSGNTISVRMKYSGYTGFTATVNDTMLTGIAYYDWSSFEGGRLYTYPLTGTISLDRNRILTTHTGISITGATGLRPDGWRTFQDENIFVRER